jgi:hypothetical protein
LDRLHIGHGQPVPHLKPFYRFGNEKPPAVPRKWLQVFHLQSGNGHIEVASQMLYVYREDCSFRLADYGLIDDNNINSR